MSKGCLRVAGTLLLQPGREGLKQAARIIRRGGLVAFPTETVYGLGAAVTDAAAVQRIFTAKGRPSDNPLIVHVAGLKQVGQVAAAVPERARKLMDRFWPGPLSLVLPRNAAVPDPVSAGLPTVAVRMPRHPVALRLIGLAGVPIAAPSANRSGRPSPTTARHVLADLAGRIDAVLDGGSCRVGVESTVVDVTGPVPVILRPGGVTREDLARALSEPVEKARWNKADAPPSPGMKYRHYAPRAPLILVTGPPHRRASLIGSLTKHFGERGLKAASLNSGPRRPAGAAQLAGRLYRELRCFDLRGVDVIVAEEVSGRGIGAAVMNRLRKAAFRVVKV